MKDYHYLYVKWDVLLLEKFKNSCLRNYGLCPSHYLSTPALSQDTKDFFEKGHRGGVSYISQRYSKATNKSLKPYEPQQESKHIIYLDANNLYGYATSKFLPTDEFKRIQPKEPGVNKYTKNSSKGCVLKVNFEYPKELKESHNVYPLAPNKTEIKKEMLSSYQLKIADHYNILFWQY